MARRRLSIGALFELNQPVIHLIGVQMHACNAILFPGLERLNAEALLMATAAPVFEARDRRDDLAMLDVVQQMPEVLRDGVACPTDPNESLTERLGKKGVDEAIAWLKQLEDHLSGAVNSSNAAQACEWLRKQFGPRFPNIPDRVKVSTVTAAVLATPAAAVASPLVGRTRAG